MRVFSLYLIACWSIIAMLAWPLFPDAPVVVLLVAVYTATPLFIFLTRRAWPFYPSAAFRLCVVRPVLYTQLLLPFVCSAGLIGAAVGLAFGQPLLVARTLAATTLAVAIVFLLIGVIGSRTLVVREVVANIANLPSEFDGFRIAQLSDLHIGPQTSRNFLRRVVSAVSEIRPDIIAVTGDLIDDRAEDVAAYAAALDTLDAPLGVFMIAGNHDVYAGWQAVQHSLRRHIRGQILVNASHMLQRGAATIALVGTGDPAGTHQGVARDAAHVGPDIDRTFALVPQQAVVIALAHNPALWPALKKRGTALTLSGHTHWGQLAIPRFGWSLASRFLDYSMGAYHEDNALLYISPGTGYWGIPFRMGALPEVTAVTLRRAPETSIVMHNTIRASRFAKRQTPEWLTRRWPHQPLVG